MKLQYRIKIEFNHILRAWNVNVEVGGDFGRAGKINPKSYVFNPYFNPHGILMAYRIITIGHTLGRLATIVGATVDGIRSYDSFKTSAENNNFSLFFEDSVRILSGWMGAVSVGALGAKAGAAIGNLGGLLGVAIGALVGGGVSGIDYWVG